MRRAVRAGFSPWMRWDDRKDYEHVNSPGVYIMAHLKRVPSGPANPLSSRVIYIGETGRSFRVRWSQFENSALGRRGHGGGDTYHVKFRKPREDIYVAALPISDLGRRDPKTRLKLTMKLLEDKILFEYYVKHWRLPACNKVAQGYVRKRG